MNVLVLHNNFPAQFKFIVPDLLSRGHNVVFVSLESHGSKIKGVKHYQVSAKAKSNSQIWKIPYRGLGKKLDHAEIFRAVFQKLRDQDFYPDITIFHSGWGIGYFLKSIFPKTKSFAYAEWWFTWNSAESSFDPSSEFSPSSHINEKVSQQYLNLTQASELLEADHIWSPTFWQREQFPAALHKRIEVIHEGVDTNLFKPSNQSYSLNSPINITYTSRALESMRCYNNFYKIIAQIMQNFPSVNLTIVGKTKPVYRPIASEKTSLYEKSMKLFKELNLQDRIRYYPRLDLSAYSELLSNSHIHFYFSRPFIASWSLLEAMSSGCCIISNITPTVSEFLTHNVNSLIVNCIDTKQSVEEISKYISDEALVRKVAHNARESALKYDYRRKLESLGEFIGY